MTITMMCGGADALDVDDDVAVEVEVVVAVVVETVVVVVAVVVAVLVAVDVVAVPGVTSSWGASVVPALELANTPLLVAVTANE
jgi:hypothetical protein